MPKTACLFALFALFALSLACSSSDRDAEPPPDPPITYPAGLTWESALTSVATTTREIDILFVLDNSPSNSSHQRAIMSQADTLVAQLEDVMGFVPDLHIGVTTTDIGVGGQPVGGCTTNGEDGVLQNAPRILGCSPPRGRFIRDVENAAGERERNYDGELRDVLSCIADLPLDGCGFEQPLEAMRRALDGSRAENDGFLRPGALLAVVVITDEDDCSARDTGLFAPRSGPDDPLGALSSFRCWEHGVVCEPDTPRTAGEYFGCESREDSSYLFAVAEYRDFLRSLKPDPSMVYFHVIGGRDWSARVNLDGEGNPELERMCDPDDENEIFPAATSMWRLHSFTRQLASRAAGSGLCSFPPREEADEEWPTLLFARPIAWVASGEACLTGSLWDSDSAREDTQPVCRGFDVSNLWTPGETRESVPSCLSDATARPCYRIESSPTCRINRFYELKADVLRDAPTTDTRFVLECLHADWSTNWGAF